jgi:ABC-type thiamine transport system ATPase subunit
MSGVQQPFGTTYEYVPVSTTAQVLGNSGAVGDTLVRIIATVTTSATSSVTILDGSTSYLLVPPVSPVGVYSITVEAQSLSGAWKVTTGAGVSVIAVGNFS